MLFQRCVFASIPVLSAAVNVCTGLCATVSGKSKCLSQNLKVKIVSENVKLLLNDPVNQTIVTETFVELLEANSSLFAKANGGKNTIEDTFTVYGILCVPSGPVAAKKIETIQF